MSYAFWGASALPAFRLDRCQWWRTSWAWWSGLPRVLGWYWEWTVSWTCDVRRSTSPEILSPLLSYQQEKRIGIWLNKIRISPPKKRWRHCRIHRIRSEERRVGNECVSTGTSACSP